MRVPAYDAYRDSGIDWLGQVPSHWAVKPLKRAFSVVTERTPRRSWALGLENIEGWSGRLLDTETEFEGEGVAFEASDILYGKLRPYLAKVHVAERPGEAVGDFHVLRAHQADVVSRYIAYQLLTREMVSQLNGSTFGARMPRVGWDFMGSVAFAFPPPAEQAAIAAFLDRETSKIDALVEAQTRLIELLKEKRQAVISHAVTKGLDPAAPMKDSGVEWLGQVPAHWEMNRLKKVARIRYGIGEPPPYQEVGTPLIRATNVDAGSIRPKGLVYVDPADIPAKRIVWLRAGDIIVVRSGAYTGDSAIVQAKDVPSIAGFDMVVTADGCHPMFLQFSLLGRWVKEGQLDLEKMRAAQPHLNAEELGNVLLMVPPLAEQVEICERLESETSRLDSMAADAETAITLLKERRAGLISAAVTGKIDVRGLAPEQAEAA